MCSGGKIFYLLQEHFYLETQATVAVPKGEDGEMELFVSTQNPTLTQVGKRFFFFKLQHTQKNTTYNTNTYTTYKTIPTLLTIQ